MLKHIDFLRIYQYNIARMTFIPPTGMKFITTFHHGRNGRHPEKNQPDKKGLIYAHTEHYPRYKGSVTSSDDPKLRLLYGNLFGKEFHDFWKQKLIEVIDAYEPDAIWFDWCAKNVPADPRNEFGAWCKGDTNDSLKITIAQYDKDDYIIGSSTIFGLDASNSAWTYEKEVYAVNISKLCTYVNVEIKTGIPTAATVKITGMEMRKTRH
jgi:hypothetical protein